MANLVYYKNEKETFKTAFQRKIKCNETYILLDKLAKHFKLGAVRLLWTSGCRKPKAIGNWTIILNCDYNSFGILCHELAHLKHHQRYLKSGHNKKHWRIMKTMIAYCERKNWFADELARRLAPKPIKAPQTKDELRLKLIACLQDNCKRYQTKIKLYGHKLKKAQKKITRLDIGVSYGLIPNPSSRIILLIPPFFPSSIISLILSTLSKLSIASPLSSMSLAFISSALEIYLFSNMNNS